MIESNNSSRDVLAPVNCTLILVSIKYMLPSFDTISNFLSPSAFSVTVYPFLILGALEYSLTSEILLICNAIDDGPTKFLGNTR